MSKTRETITYTVMLNGNILVETTNKAVAEEIQAQNEGSIIFKSRVFAQLDSDAA
jgi:hypothetical protein